MAGAITAFGSIKAAFSTRCRRRLPLSRHKRYTPTCRIRGATRRRQTRVESTGLKVFSPERGSHHPCSMVHMEFPWLRLRHKTIIQIIPLPLVTRRKIMHHRPIPKDLLFRMTIAVKARRRLLKQTRESAENEARLTMTLTMKALILLSLHIRFHALDTPMNRAIALPMVMIIQILRILHRLHLPLLRRPISLVTPTRGLARRQHVVTRRNLPIPTIHLERFRFVTTANLLPPVRPVQLLDLPTSVVA